MVADKIHSVLGKGGTILIYCRAGMSRSATLCIAYFMRHHNMSMEEAFQFVKQRRPIIHPNAGFVRQLRIYEDKLKFRRSGIKRKYEEDDFSYATVKEIPEIDAFEITDFADLGVIKPRPKPRIMKPKLVTPDIGTLPLEVAQSYSITEMCICFAEGQQQTAVVNPKRPSTKRTQSIRSKRTGTRPKTSGTRPISMPVRPRTPAGLLDQNNIISNWDYHDPMSVAESIEPVAMETTTPVTKAGGSFKKKPFSKISEPAKVAVSYQTFPWALCAPFSHKANFHTEVPYYTVFAELHLPLAEKSEEVTLECPISCEDEQKMVKPSPTNLPSRFSIPKSSSMTPHDPISARARILVAPVRLSPAAKLVPVILECPGIFQAQKVDALNTFNITTSASCNPSQRVPSRFSNTSSIGSGFSRTSATRASIKLPGVKFSPVPLGHQKRPVPNLDLDFRMVGSCYQPPLILERVESNTVRRFNPKMEKVKTVLWCPRQVGVASMVSTTVFERAEKDTTLSFKLPMLLTVPKRSVLVKTEVLNTFQVNAYVLEQVLDTVMPQKEYPYYYPARKSSFIINMMKATELPSVEVSWLAKAPARARATQDQALVAQVEEIKSPVRKIATNYQPQIHWAAARCEFDPYSVEMATVPMEDLPRACKAQKGIQKSIKDSKHRSAACHVIDHTHYFEQPTNMPRYKAPEKYNTYMIRRFCAWPLYEASMCRAQQPCEMVNLYCEPTPFKAWAKVLCHQEPINNQKTNTSASQIQGFAVATCQIATYNDNLSELVDIPDVVGNIDEIKPLLIQQKDPAKMMIWMEIFKRSVIKARPIKPFVKVTEMLPIATTRQLQVFDQCSTFTNIPSTVPTARTFVSTVSMEQLKPTVSKGKMATEHIHYAVEVTDCFRADVLHPYNPQLLKIKAIAKREKAIETTEYIRNYTVTDWISVMEEKEVKSWVKAPELILTARASGILYMPLRPCFETKMDVFGLTEDHSVLEGSSVVSWLSRQPFRYTKLLAWLCKICFLIFSVIRAYLR